MIYLDASALVSLFASEPMSLRVSQVLAQASEPVAASTWTLVECVSAFAIKARFGSLSADTAVALSRQIRADAGKDYALEGLLDEDAVQAARLIERCATPLRAGDALHLAICNRLGARLLTLDHEMAKAAGALSLQLATV